MSLIPNKKFEFTLIFFGNEDSVLITLFSGTVSLLVDQLDTNCVLENLIFSTKDIENH